MPISTSHNGKLNASQRFGGETYKDLASLVGNTISLRVSAALMPPNKLLYNYTVVKLY